MKAVGTVVNLFIDSVDIVMVGALAGRRFLPFPMAASFDFLSLFAAIRPRSIGPRSIISGLANNGKLDTPQI